MNVCLFCGVIGTDPTRLKKRNVFVIKLKMRRPTASLWQRAIQASNRNQIMACHLCPNNFGIQPHIDCIV